VLRSAVITQALDGLVLIEVTGVPTTLAFSESGLSLGEPSVRAKKVCAN
jgi:hypothetical protein